MDDPRLGGQRAASQPAAGHTAPFGQEHGGHSPFMPTSDSQPTRASERAKRVDNVGFNPPPAATPADPDQGLPRSKRRGK